MKLRVKLNIDSSTYTYNRYYLEYYSSFTGLWLTASARTFYDKSDALNYKYELLGKIRS
jgi:hypothetical protein